MPHVETVQIFLYVNDRDELFLEDSEGHDAKGSITTEVNANCQVQWLPKPNGGVITIDQIFKKDLPDNPNVLGAIDHVGDGTWMGGINVTAADGDEESYGITYTTSNGQFTDDPKMKMVLGSSGTGG